MKKFTVTLTVIADEDMTEETLEHSLESIQESDFFDSIEPEIAKINVDSVREQD